jgi:hydrogenase maturation GTPase hydF
MGLNQTVSAERVHIAFFGLRNVGKSSLVNAVTGQELSVVSDVKGTTTDPVKKAMELLPLGPVVIIDTAGIDDEGELGSLRIQKSKEVLDITDIAVLVTEADRELTEPEKELAYTFKTKKLPFIIVLNKADFAPYRKEKDNEILVSAKEGTNILKLKEKLAGLIPDKSEKYILKDLVNKGDTVILVMPIDESAPKGRIILPQQEVLRELLEIGCITLCVQDGELKESLSKLKSPPSLVITDSQVFKKVSEIVPDDIRLTSFSILFARYRGGLAKMLEGADMLSKLKDGDRVLISEGCTHHRQCEDIGTVKLPRWIREYSGASPHFEFTSGGTYPDDLTSYKLIVHCGGCMLNEAAMKSRIGKAVSAGIPIVNYGMAIAEMTGILKRAMKVF